MGTMTRMSRVTAASAAALLMAAAVTLAQGNRFETSVPFQVDKAVAFAGGVGPVKVTGVKVTNLGRGYGRGGFSLRSANPPSELATTLRFAFDVDNPTDDEWDVTFTVELLDKGGKVIDRASKKENYEDEAKVLELDHSLLEYVLPLVTQVRITLQGERS